MSKKEMSDSLEATLQDSKRNASPSPKKPRNAINYNEDKHFSSQHKALDSNNPDYKLPNRKSFKKLKSAENESLKRKQSNLGVRQEYHKRAEMNDDKLHDADNRSTIVCKSQDDEESLEILKKTIKQQRGWIDHQNKALTSIMKFLDEEKETTERLTKELAVANDKNLKVQSLEEDLAAANKILEFTKSSEDNFTIATTAYKKSLEELEFAKMNLITDSEKKDRKIEKLQEKNQELKARTHTLAEALVNEVSSLQEAVQQHELAKEGWNAEKTAMEKQIQELKKCVAYQEFKKEQNAKEEEFRKLLDTSHNLAESRLQENKNLQEEVTKLEESLKLQIAVRVEEMEKRQKTLVVSKPLPILSSLTPTTTNTASLHFAGQLLANQMPNLTPQMPHVQQPVSQVYRPSFMPPPRRMMFHNALAQMTNFNFNGNSVNLSQTLNQTYNQ